jgi:hypothetical protein
MGEVRYNRYRFSTATNWIREHPRRFLTLTGRRIVEFWFPPDSRSACLVTLLSIPGLLLLWKKARPVAGFFTAVFAVYPLLYYLAESVLRYRYPILWLSLLAAGYMIQVTVQRFRLMSRRREPAGSNH